MKLDTLYRRAVAAGIAADPRGSEAVGRILEEEKSRAEKLDDKDRDAWETDRLFNPYADTRILTGDPAGEIKKIIAGIDMDAAEIVLAHTLNRDLAAGIDGVVAHHPQGLALAQLPEVMRVQADMLAAYGVAVSVAEQLLDQRMGEVERRVLPANHTRAVDAARLLGLPMMCVHTPADNCVSAYLTALFEKEKPERLKDVLELLRTIPEYRAAIRRMAGPKIVNG
ncbi:MAG: NGG1p interacting factor NIF3, partial [Candidatus Aminicenantes bacterium]|nr:NGG1p interacting factor NIF3 [Candidatus Aminicenantes bacterium]